MGLKVEVVEEEEGGREGRGEGLACPRLRTCCRRLKRWGEAGGTGGDVG